jgi:hypothetical protein
MSTTRLHPRRAAHANTIRVVALVLLVVAASLIVASTLHLAGLVHGQGGSFDADHAGIAEAVIAVALLGAAITMRRAPAHARTVGLAAAAFAVVGFLVGLRFTLGGGHLPDIAYHLTGLPILIGSVIALWRAR